MDQIIKQFRHEIDLIDSKIIKLLNKRLDISKTIGIFKKQKHLCIYDINRENEIIHKYLSMSKKEYSNEILEIVKTILKTSKDLQ